MKNMTFKHYIIFAIISLPAFTSLHATTRYVRHPNTFAGGTSPFSSWENAATNIQQAINDAPSGGMVVVSNGVYTNGSTISVTKSIALRSVNGAGATFIDGNEAYQCLYMYGNAANVVDGFTFQHGYTEAPFSLTTGEGVGGVWMRHGTIINCVVSNNHATVGLGGIFVRDITMTNCTIIHNLGEGGVGAGLYLDHNSIMSNCTVVANTNINSTTIRTGAGMRMRNSQIWHSEITDNVSTGTSVHYALGGGVYLDSAYACSINDSVISGNITHGSGGGIYVRHSLSDLTMQNVTISENISSTYGGGIGIFSGSMSLNDCIIGNNTAHGSWGGGVMVSEGVDMVTLANCRVVDNKSAI